MNLLSLRAVPAALAVLAAAPSFAATLDFDGVTSFASVADFYNGGTDSAGVTGPALGIRFGGDVIGLANDALGPYYSNAPSPRGTMTVVGSSATMNVAAGFVGNFGFSYSADSFVPNAVTVWSGLNGSGNVVASFNLIDNARAGGCSSSAYCYFDAVTTTFNGVAHSVTFGNAAGFAVFDNIGISVVPEPSALVLMLAGCAAVGSLARRRMG